MRPAAKHRLAIVEQSAHAVLSPLGFKKQKSNWRRALPEVLQQFSIVSMQVEDDYRPEWGLNLLSRCEDPRPPAWKLDVQWTFEMSVENLRERLRYFDCLTFGLDMPDQRRIALVTSLLTKYVNPCFESFRTEDSVRRMVGDRKHPLRAHSFGELPDEWWPEEQRMGNLNQKSTPTIIRAWRPKGGGCGTTQ